MFDIGSVKVKLPLPGNCDESVAAKSVYYYQTFVEGIGPEICSVDKITELGF